MSINLPVGKILSIQSMAMLLKDSLQTQNVKQIYRYVFSHSPSSFSSPSSLQTPTVCKKCSLMESLNPVEAYDKEVYLNKKAREDLG